MGELLRSSHRVVIFTAAALACAHDFVARFFASQSCVVEASFGTQMEEPMAFSPLRGSDRCPADDSLKKYEQSVKLSGMCLMPQLHSSEVARAASLHLLIR